MPPLAPIWKGYQGLVLQVGGSFKFAERLTYTEIISGKWVDVFNYANAHYRGTIWTIAVPGGVNENFIVDDCSATNERGGKGTVTTNYCFLGTPPPDEFSLTPFEINPPIERNPFFSPTLQAEDLQKARQAFSAATADGKTSVVQAASAVANAALIIHNDINNCAC